ncbi:hypothetical protein ACWFR1_10770 [Streptomyces sp. NPDC055103]
MSDRVVAMVWPYERGVALRLGRRRGVRDPESRFKFPLTDRMSKVAPRTVTDVIAGNPVALPSRNPQILAEIAAEKNSAIVFPAQLLEAPGP